MKETSQTSEPQAPRPPRRLTYYESYTMALKALGKRPPALPRKFSAQAKREFRVDLILTAMSYVRSIERTWAKWQGDGRDT